MEMREGKGENLLMHTFCKRHSDKVHSIAYTEIISIGTRELMLNIQIREERAQHQLSSPASLAIEDSPIAVRVKERAHERTAVPSIPSILSFVWNETLTNCLIYRLTRK